MKDPRIGKRVSMHPARDEWMQGDQYGTVVGIGNRQTYVDRKGKRTEARPLRIKLDKSGRIVRAHPDEPTFIDY
jgi:hypothetical protein